MTHSDIERLSVKKCCNCCCCFVYTISLIVQHNISYSSFGGDTENIESLLEEEELVGPENVEDDRCLQSLHVRIREPHLHEDNDIHPAASFWYTRRTHIFLPIFLFLLHLLLPIANSKSGSSSSSLLSIHSAKVRSNRSR